MCSRILIVNTKESIEKERRLRNMTKRSSIILFSLLIAINQKEKSQMPLGGGEGKPTLRVGRKIGFPLFRRERKEPTVRQTMKTYSKERNRKKKEYLSLKNFRERFF